MIAVDIQQGLTDAWNSIATFVPKFIGFLVIVLVGYVVAKLVAKALNALLERVGFDRWVERGWLKSGLDRARTDASDVLALLAFWAVFLLVLQLAFGVFGPNPISVLLTGLIAYLPKVFVAMVILVIAAALAKVATDVLLAVLGSVPAGVWIARIAGRGDHDLRRVRGAQPAGDRAGDRERLVLRDPRRAGRRVHRRGRGRRDPDDATLLGARERLGGDDGSGAEGARRAASRPRRYRRHGPGPAARRP